MAWNFTCWCILTTFRTDKILIVCWFSSFWWHFHLVEQIKFAISRHFLENAWEEWREIWHVEVSWPPSKLIKFWSQSVHFGSILTLVKQVKFGDFRRFSVEHMGEWPKIWHADVSWPHLEVITFWSWSVAFPHFGSILTETGQFCGFRAFSWERIGGISWNLVCWCVLTTFRTDYFFWSWSVNFVMTTPWFHASLTGLWHGVGGAVRFLVVGTIGQEERPPRGQLWMEQCLTSLKYWPI